MYDYWFALFDDFNLQIVQSFILASASYSTSYSLAVPTVSTCNNGNLQIHNRKIKSRKCRAWTVCVLFPNLLGLYHLHTW